MALASLNKKRNKIVEKRILPQDSHEVSKKIQNLNISSITIPEYYPQKFSAKYQIDIYKNFIESGLDVCQPIIVRKVKEDYQLISGLDTYRAYKKLSGIQYVKCVVIENLSEAEALLSSIALGSKEAINYWESTVAIINYLILTTKIEDKVDTIVHKLSGQKRHIHVDKVIVAANIIKAYYNFLKGNKEITSNKTIMKELTIERMTAIDNAIEAAGIDLNTFVFKRLPLLNLPIEIKKALSQGRISFQKAIALGNIGHTTEIRLFSDKLSLEEVKEQIIKERGVLIKKVLKESITLSELREEINLANTRILQIGLDRDNKSLAFQELGDRQSIKDAIQYRCEVKKVIKKITDQINTVNKIQQIDDRTKSNVLKTLERVCNMIAKAA